MSVETDYFQRQTKLPEMDVPLQDLFIGIDTLSQSCSTRIESAERGVNKIIKNTLQRLDLNVDDIKNIFQQLPEDSPAFKILAGAAFTLNGIDNLIAQATPTPTPTASREEIQNKYLLQCCGTAATAVGIILAYKYLNKIIQSRMRGPRPEDIGPETESTHPLGSGGYKTNGHERPEDDNLNL